jgi:hypothetical protein
LSIDDPGGVGGLENGQVGSGVQDQPCVVAENQIGDFAQSKNVEDHRVEPARDRDQEVEDTDVAGTACRGRVPIGGIGPVMASGSIDPSHRQFGGICGRA